MQLEGFIKETLRPIEKYLTMKGVVELMINQAGEILLETENGKIKSFKDPSLTLERLEAMLFNIANWAGQEFSIQNPILSTYLPKYGFRIQGVIANAVESSISISIRVGNTRVFPLKFYFGEQADAVKQLILEAKNIVVAGGTSTGKTTCVNSLITAIPLEKRIISLENMRELNIPHLNKVCLLASESKDEQMYFKLANSILRMRPDRILIGELTIASTKFYLRLSNTGHSGTLTTLHADSPLKALDAMRQNLILDGASDSGLINYVGSTVQYVIQMTRQQGRRITATLYKTGISNGQFTAQEVF